MIERHHSMTERRKLEEKQLRAGPMRSDSSQSALDEIVEVLLAVAESIRDRQRAGMLSGLIDPSQIWCDESKRTWQIVFNASGESEPISFPAEATWYEASTREELQTLPLKITEAQQQVDQIGLVFSVRLIDSYALGEFACRITADCSVSEYLQSPRVLQSIPVELRPLIDRALGFDPSQRCEDIEDLMTQLRTIQSLLRQEALTEDLSESLHLHRQLTKTDVDSGDEQAGLPFERIGHFQILRRIGSGGMGDVYEGYDESLKRKVAIKVLPPELGRHDSFVKRFYSEAASVAKIVHPHIVQIFFIGEDHGHHFFAMEFVDGESLAEQLGRAPLSVADALNVIVQILEGLQAAHRVGLVHRDVKPGNILREQKTNRYLLVDFGLVKSLQDDDGPTHSGTVLGTMDYISPEQGSSRAVDARSDLYSLGVVLYEIISGKLPFYADSPTGMIFQHVYERPVPLSEVAGLVPVEVSAIVSKMMAKNPAHRYADAQAALDDVRAFQNGEQLPSHAEQILQNDADYFFNPIAKAGTTRSATAIISAPGVNDFEEELEILSSGPSSLWGRIVERLYDWFETKSPHWAERLQNTQLQVDRAVLKLERHRDLLASLNRDAQLLLKQLQQDIKTKEKLQDDSEAEDDFLLQELRAACTEQVQQADTIQRQLHQVNARLAQVRTERDVLLARLRSAETRKRGGNASRSRTVVTILILVVSCMILLFVLKSTQFRTVQSGQGQPALKTIAATKAGAQSHHWPIESPREVIIPLQAKVRAMDIAVTRYIDKPAYTVIAALDNNTLIKYYFRSGLNYVVQTGFLGGPAGVKAIALSPQATLTAVAAGDNSIRLFETNKRGMEEYRRLEGHVQPVVSMTFSGDESTLVSLSEDRTVRYWDIRSGTEIRRFEVGRNDAELMAANSKLSRLLIGKRFRIDDSLVLWNSLESRPEKVFPTDAAPATLALSADARLAMAFAAGRIDVWNALTAEKIRSFAGVSQAAAFAPDVNRALTLQNRSLKLWQTDTGELIETRELQIKSSQRARILLAQNGAMGVVATSDKTLHLCFLPEVPPPKDLVYQFHAETPIHALDIASDGVWIAGGGAGMIYLWNMDHPPASFVLESPNQISSLAFSPNGGYLAYGTGQQGSTTNYVGVRKMEYTDHVQRFLKKTTDWQKLEGFEDRISSVAWDQSGKLILAASQGGQLKSWDPGKNKVESALQLNVPILHLSQLKEGARCLLVTGAHALELWDYAQSTSPEEFLQTAYEGIDCAVSDEHQLIAIADRRGLIHLLSQSDHSQVSVLESHSDLVTDLCFVPSSRLLAAAYRSGVVRLWDTRQFKMIKEYRNDPSPVTAIQASADARHVIAASLNGNVSIWKLP
ncbi:serine/threonine protein kinase [Gimesia maris DSM 8797]|uniref:Serine/threonine-protein kinase PknB n=2 Tax=Gimesia maris TaxID=122 RepID=A0ABX5YKG4_9PLAN|nr:serine/threonine protein kinase [Gimesia maris DSM 8797]QEG16117.1 Serine/threonine-protein kinase PknB [Gimesia maris]QGQ30640.1 protein kinase [Gimesia maris]